MDKCREGEGMQREKMGRGQGRMMEGGGGEEREGDEEGEGAADRWTNTP